MEKAQLLLAVTGFPSFPMRLCSGMSGFTTTGPSVLDNSLELQDGSILPHGIVDLPKGLLYWRSLTHWLGCLEVYTVLVLFVPSFYKG